VRARLKVERRRAGGAAVGAAGARGAVAAARAAWRSGAKSFVVVVEEEERRGRRPLIAIRFVVGLCVGVWMWVWMCLMLIWGVCESEVGCDACVRVLKRKKRREQGQPPLHSFIALTALLAPHPQRTSPFHPLDCLSRRLDDLLSPCKAAFQGTSSSCSHPRNRDHALARAQRPKCKPFNLN